MILDKENLFSDAQAVTVTAGSTNVIKLPAKSGRGKPMPLLIQVTEAFATCTSVKVGVRTSATLSGSSLNAPTTLVESAAIPVASLIAGYKFPIGFLPLGTLGYVDLYFTVAGSNATAGKITAGITFNEPGTL